MKYIILLSVLLITISVQAAPSCSKNGTRVIYTNGVLTEKKDANIALRNIKDLGLNSSIDLNPAMVNYTLAYNYKEDIAKDFLEAAVQRFPNGFLKSLGVTNPYAAYMGYLHGGLLDAIYAASLNSIMNELLKIQENWLINYKSTSLYLPTVNEIKTHYEKALNAGERVFAISHSQGGLFMKDAYDITSFADKQKYFSGFQIASPLLNEMTPKFGYATHDKDRLINAVRTAVGALPANMTAPSVVSNAREGNVVDNIIEYFLNHGIVTTYLYDSTIRAQVIPKLIKAAQLLDSNCKVAIKYHRENSDVKFIASGLTLPENSGVIFRWDFGDNQFGKVSKNVILHSYNAPGIYDVTLTLIFPNGDKISSKTKIRIPNLIVSYTSDKLKANISANEPEAVGQTYTWYFGDNSEPVVTTTRAVTHEYLSPGNYTVFLRVEDAKGNTTEAEAMISVQLPNEVIIHSNFVHSEGGLLLFVNGGASRNSLDEPLTYIWDFGDGFIEVNSDPIAMHSYQYAGYYNVSLLVKDPFGRTASTMKQVFMPGNYPYVTYKTAGRNVEFTIHDDFNDSDASYTWDFGDGIENAEMTSSKTITHSYDDVMKKDFSVKISTRNVDVYQISDVLPDRSLSIISYRIMNRNVEFYLSTVLSSENVPLSYRWDFGDGQAANSTTPTVVHRYYNEGTYRVTVGVYDEIGRLLFNQEVFILADQINGGWYGNVPVLLEDGRTGLSLIMQGLQPTSQIGFNYELTNPVYGTCYVKGFEYYYVDGVQYINAPLYNCTIYDDYFLNY